MVDQWREAVREGRVGGPAAAGTCRTCRGRIAAVDLKQWGWRWAGVMEMVSTLT